MNILLDEDVPVPLIKLLNHILREHVVHHVLEIGWSGKKDVNLYRAARVKGYNVVVTNNLRQLNDPDECDAIKSSGVHVVFYSMGNGLDGLALGSAAICAAIRRLIDDLGPRDRQHIAWITAISPSKKRFRMVDPAREPPSAYWR